jgi:putative membrane protein
MRRGSVSARAVAGLALGAGLAAGPGACKNSGDLRTEAPGQNAAAPGSVDRNAGAATSASAGVNAGPNPANNDKDTTALPGTAGSGTAAVGRPSGATGQPGAGVLHTGDPSDADVRLVLGAIHKTEVDASQLAVGKAQNPRVRQYAQAMLQMHQGPARSAPTPGGGAMSGASDLLVPLQEHAGKTLVALQAASGPAFDRAYITSQVESHQNSVQLLSRLETATKDNALLAQVRQLQGEVQRHLEQARAIQASLGGAT